ncbi:cyclin-D2-1-like isoform X2 [Typha latifolia]|uniref:cyclin-D2-1-like isoform X2 n=1 Tax=Typha latifolia TaxID=4733 RepID=UPI003C2C0D0D
MAVTPDLLHSASSSLLCPEDADDVASWGVDCATSDEWTLPLPDPGGRQVPDLLAAEAEHVTHTGFPALEGATTSRQDAVYWILKVNEFYGFRPVTAWLSVNYLDRFLSTNGLPAGRWAMQLVAVACLSVAAKMEETHVPLLLDLQILEPEFVFDPRTVRRMELLLMSALGWRMLVVTPFDFLPHFVPEARAQVLLPRAAQLILGTRRVVDFLGYRPSVIAAAGVLCSANEIADYVAEGFDASLLCFDKWVDKDAVTRCRQLMEEYLTDACPSSRLPKPRHEPPSPVGVLDAAACGSCDTHRSGAAPLVAESAGAEQPPLKRQRCTASIDTAGDGGKPKKP